MSEHLRVNGIPNSARASRLILGFLTDDQDVPSLIDEEINGCPKCWRYIAVGLASRLGGMLWQDLDPVAEDEIPGLPHNAIAEMEREIIHDLDMVAEGWQLADPDGLRDLMDGDGDD